ncbi:hypothetical protein Aca07nite_41350 [Actinoplanes capillaceus]|uniref:Uncharacterized protein n=1 Tax=Actinoplanes campanulatus TaxID=113559 RepID=A0ABQ3WKW8_9ACTN|nr:hypothetical protein [Actinoplanes capillaceus]GID46860.1 hypothetical protein Aca07nite_41350 [Actinoplanes capillaceus]
MQAAAAVQAQGANGGAGEIDVADRIAPFEEADPWAGAERLGETPVGAGPEDVSGLREGVQRGEVDRAVGGHAIHQVEYGHRGDHRLWTGPEIDLDGRRRHGAQPEGTGQIGHPIMIEPPDPVKAGNSP